MSPQAEMSTSLQETDPAAAESSERSVALIGPNESTRRTVARALAGSEAGFVREFAAYPSKLTEVPRILEQNFNVVMIDVDSDESCALDLVEAIAKNESVMVMVYSTRNNPDLMMRCMRAGARDFLPLPADDDAASPAPEAKPARKPQLAVVERPTPVVEVIEDESPVAAKSVEMPAAVRRADATPVPFVPALLVETRSETPAAPEVEVPITAGIRFSEVQDEEEEARSKRGSMGKWAVLAIVPIAAALGLAGFLLRPTHQAEAVPAPVEASTPAEQPAANAGTPSAPVPQATAPSTKPAAGSQAARSSETAAPVPPTPKSVAPDEMNAQLTAPSRIGGDMKKPQPKEEAPPTSFAPGAMESGGTMPGSVFAQPGGVKVRPGLSAISAGVAAGMLIHKSEPIYPRIAQDARVSGTVVIAATITKTGALGGLHVVSGPPMLVNAALEAARTWRYRPYLLDNQPVEVQTTISIVFNLGR